MFAKCPVSVGMSALLINPFGHMSSGKLADVTDLFNLICATTSSSLEVCASTGRRSLLLDVCKMHALQCIGKKYTTAEESTCIWPQRNTAGCAGCHMWENCNGMDMQGDK